MFEIGATTQTEIKPVLCIFKRVFGPHVDNLTDNYIVLFNEILLIELKNIDTWHSHEPNKQRMPQFFIRAQETIIYR